LSAAVGNLFVEEFCGQILPFDEDAARVFPKTLTSREAIGRPISRFDAVIASVCRSRGASVATRNITDFEHCGITILNPWKTDG